MRLSAGTAMIVQAVLSLLAGPLLGAVLFHMLSICLGLLLLAGLWTPVAGTLVAAEALWNVFSSGHPARLFGWRRLEIRDRKSQDPPSLM
jgi:hypothetical protein